MALHGQQVVGLVAGLLLCAVWFVPTASSVPADAVPAQVRCAVPLECDRCARQCPPPLHRSTDSPLAPTD